MARVRLAAWIAALLLTLFPVAAWGDMGWTQPQRLASGTTFGSVVVGVDGKGVATIAWTTQGAVYVATRAPGGTLTRTQTVGTPPGALHLAVAGNGDAVLAWSDGRNGTVYTSVRQGNGAFGPVQTIYDPVLDSPASPTVAIAPNGWAIVGVPSGDMGTTFVAALRAPGGAFGASQRVSDSFHDIPYYVSVGIDSRGDGLVAYGGTDCPNLPPDYRCENPVMASTAPAGGQFGSPAAIGQGSGQIAAPSVLVTPTGHATVGFIACTVPHYCTDDSQLVDADLPGGFGKPVTIAKGTAMHDNQPAGTRPELGIQPDGSPFTWLWSGPPTVLFAKRAGSAWTDTARVGGDKGNLGATRSDADGDVIFYGRSTACPCEGDNLLMRVQRWSIAEPVLSAPVALSQAEMHSGDVAPGPGERMVAAWTEGQGADVIVIRAYEDLPPAAVASDSIAPVVAVVAAPATAAPVMRMRTSCDERCSVSAQGVLRVASRRYPVAASAREAAAGHAATLVIAVRGRDRARVRSALRRGGRRTLAVALTARDSAGNKRVVKRMFHLRKPS